MRWAGQVAPRSMRSVFWWRSLKKRAHLDYIGLDRIILKQILNKQNRRTVDWGKLAEDKICGGLF
jgi:hypothetical protein